MLTLGITCEGCRSRLPIFKRKKKCEDCGFIFCTDCATSTGRFQQCYRCKVLTHLPMNRCDVESLTLKDLQWFLDTKNIVVSSNDLREKPILVERVLGYSRQMTARPVQTQSSSNLYPTLQPEEGHADGLFRTDASAPISRPAEEINEDGDQPRSDLNNEIPNPITGRHPIFNLDSVQSRNHIFELTIMELKVLLARNFMSFHGCCEKSELQEKVCSIWDSQERAQTAMSDENLCKLCWEAAVNALFLECGHMLTCHQCGKLLQYCPICRQVIVRVVRAFKA